MSKPPTRIETMNYGRELFGHRETMLIVMMEERRIKHRGTEDAVKQEENRDQRPPPCRSVPVIKPEEHFSQMFSLTLWSLCLCVSISCIDLNRIVHQVPPFTFDCVLLFNPRFTNNSRSVFMFVCWAGIHLRQWSERILAIASSLDCEPRRQSPR